MTKSDESVGQLPTEPAPPPPIELEQSTLRGQRWDAWGWFALVLGSVLLSGAVIEDLYLLVERLDGKVVVPSSWELPALVLLAATVLIAVGFGAVFRGRLLQCAGQVRVSGSLPLPRPWKVPVSVALLSVSLYATLAALGVLSIGFSIAANEANSGGAAGAGVTNFLVYLVVGFLVLCAVAFAVWMGRVLRGGPLATAMARIASVPLGFFFLVGGFALLFSVLLFVRAGLPVVGWSLLPVSLNLLVAAVVVRWSPRISCPAGKFASGSTPARDATGPAWLSGVAQLSARAGQDGVPRVLDAPAQSFTSAGCRLCG